MVSFLVAKTVSSEGNAFLFWGPVYLLEAALGEHMHFFGRRVSLDIELSAWVNSGLSVG